RIMAVSDVSLYSRRASVAVGNTVNPSIPPARSYSLLEKVPSKLKIVDDFMLTCFHNRGTVRATKVGGGGDDGRFQKRNASCEWRGHRAALRRRGAAAALDARQPVHASVLESRGARAGAALYGGDARSARLWRQFKA